MFPELTLKYLPVTLFPLISKTVCYYAFSTVDHLKTVRRYHIVGDSVGLPFELQFNVHEEQMSILELHVHLRPDAEVELTQFLKT